MIHHRWQESAACRDAWSTAAADGVVGVVPPLPVDRYERVSEFIRPQSQVIGWILWLTHGSINCSARYYSPHLRPATHTTVRETYKYLRSWLWNVGPTLTVRQVQGWPWSRPRVGIKKNKTWNAVWNDVLISILLSLAIQANCVKNKCGMRINRTALWSRGRGLSSCSTSSCLFFLFLAAELRCRWMTHWWCLILPHWHRLRFNARSLSVVL